MHPTKELRSQRYRQALRHQPDDNLLPLTITSRYRHIDVLSHFVESEILDESYDSSVVCLDQSRSDIDTYQQSAKSISILRGFVVGAKKKITISCRLIGHVYGQEKCDCRSFQAERPPLRIRSRIAMWRLAKARGEI